VPQLLAEAIFLPHFFVKKDSNNNPLRSQNSKAALRPPQWGGAIFFVLLREVAFSEEEKLQGVFVLPLAHSKASYGP